MWLKVSTRVPGWWQIDVTVTAKWPLWVFRNVTPVILDKIRSNFFAFSFNVLKSRFNCVQCSVSHIIWKAKNYLAIILPGRLLFLFVPSVSPGLLDLCHYYYALWSSSSIDKHYQRKSVDRKAQISQVSGTNSLLICALRSADFPSGAYQFEQPHAQSLVLFPIVFGYNMQRDEPEMFLKVACSVAQKKGQHLECKKH